MMAFWPGALFIVRNGGTLQQQTYRFATPEQVCVERKLNAICLHDGDILLFIAYVPCKRGSAPGCMNEHPHVALFLTRHGIVAEHVDKMGVPTWNRWPNYFRIEQI